MTALMLVGAWKIRTGDKVLLGKELKEVVEINSYRCNRKRRWVSLVFDDGSELASPADDTNQVKFHVLATDSLFPYEEEQ